MANTRSQINLNLYFNSEGPSYPLIKCSCGITLSIIYINIIPKNIPIAGGRKLLAKVIEGRIKLVKLATNITPAEKERLKFIPQEGIFLKKRAIRDPKDVIKVKKKLAINVIIIKL